MKNSNIVLILFFFIEIFMVHKKMKENKILRKIYFRIQTMKTRNDF